MRGIFMLGFSIMVLANVYPCGGASEIELQ